MSFVKKPPAPHTFHSRQNTHGAHLYVLARCCPVAHCRPAQIPTTSQNLRNVHEVEVHDTPAFREFIRHLAILFKLKLMYCLEQAR
jgi:hypothetical protein